MRRLWYLAVGCWMLARGLDAQTIQGDVVERGSNRALASGVVILFDEPGNEVARTQLAQGRFTLTAPAAGRYRLRFDGIGYRTTFTSLFDLGADATLAVTLQVRPQTPFALDTVDVAGEPVPIRMVDFYERRRAGFGSFMTRTEWEPYVPDRVTDVMRRMMGFSIVPNPRYMQGGDSRQYLVINNRVGDYLGQRCPPLVFVDGMFMGSSAGFDFDNLLAIEHLEGIELYNGPGNMPAEFNRSGAACGVISVWTLATSSTTVALSNHLDLGWQVGARFTKEGVQNGRIGAQAVVALKGIIELYPAMNMILSSATGSTEIAGWQMLGAVRVRPFGARTPWFLGTGLTAITVRETFLGNVRTSVDEQYHVVMTGLTLPLGLVRPFLEVQLLGPLTPSRSEVHIYTGFGFRIY